MNDVKSQFEIDLRKQNLEFIEAVSKTFAAAEEHMQLPTGTLVDIHKDIGFIAVMKMSSTIEPLINEALEKEIRRFRKMKVEDEGENELADFVVGNGDRKRKATLAHDMGLITEECHKFIQAIYEIRNHYAHNVKNIHLSMFEVTEKLAVKNNKIWLNLAGMERANKYKDLVLAMMRNSPIYYRFAGFLSDALHVVKPSPYKGLLGLYAGDDQAMSPDKTD